MINHSRLTHLLGTERFGSTIVGLSALAQVGGWLSATDMTEHVWGSSGRGTPRARDLLKFLADEDILERQRRGRNTYYHVPAALLPRLQAAPNFSQEHHDLEMKFLREGTRPVPKGAVL